VKALHPNAQGLCALLFVALLMSAGAAQASVTISANATKNMSCSGAICSPTAKQAVLNVNDLTNMLADGDVKITTGAGAVTITVESPFSWISAHRLTLDAYYNVSFRAAVTVAGQGAVTIITNDGGSGGDLIFFPGASLDFSDTSSSLVVSGTAYELVSDIKSLARAVAGNPAGDYALAKNYDAAADRAYKKDPVTTTFTGRLEGLGHRVTNLTIKNYEQDASVGFFQQLASPAVVRDFALENAKVITGNQSAYVGGIAGNGLNGGTLIACSVTGSFQVYGVNPRAGGLIGWSAAAISRSSASVSIQFHATVGSVGGLTGVNEGPIEHSVATGTISGEGDADAGGLSSANTGLISYSHASVDISMIDVEIGGLVGENFGGIESSYATGTITQLATTFGYCGNGAL
jgi:hypothetical protein